MSLRLAVDNDDPLNADAILSCGKYFKMRDWKEAIQYHLENMWSESLPAFREPWIRFPPNLTLKYDAKFKLYYAFGWGGNIYQHYSPTQSITITRWGSPGEIQSSLATFIRSETRNCLKIQFAHDGELILMKRNNDSEIYCKAYNIRTTDPYV